jgi:hypothetical protein
MPGCALTSDLTLDCRDSLGGIKNVFFIEFANVNAVTDTAGVVTALTKAAGKKFYKYELPRETGSFKSAVQSNEQNGTLFFNQELKIVVNKLQTTIRNEVLLLAMNRLMAVAEDRNGKYWLLGRTGGLLLSGGELGSGTAYGDRSGAELDFSGQEPQPAIEVTTAIGLQLTSAGA